MRGLSSRIEPASDGHELVGLAQDLDEVVGEAHLGLEVRQTWRGDARETCSSAWGSRLKTSLMPRALAPVVEP